MSRQAIKYAAILILLLGKAGFVKSQNSFTKEISGLDDMEYFFPSLSDDATAPLSVMIPGNGQFSLFELSSDGNVLEAHQVSIPNYNIGYDYGRYVRMGNYHLVGVSAIHNEGEGEEVYLVCMVNFETGEKWVKQTWCSESAGSPFIILPPDKVLISHGYGCENPLNFFTMGTTLYSLPSGQRIFSRYYSPSSLVIGSNFQAYDLKKLPNGNYSVVNQIKLMNNPQKFLSLTQIFPINGIFQKGISITTNDELEFFHQSIDEAGNIYLTGTIRSSGIDYPEGFIAKFDQDYHLLWIKKLKIDGFFVSEIKIKNLSNGNVVFLCSGNGDLPVVTGGISSDGTLLWSRGYAFPIRDMTVSQDDAIIFSSGQKYFEDGTSANAPIIIWTTANGDIEDCGLYDVCIELEDTNLAFREEGWWDAYLPDPIYLPSSSPAIEPITLHTDELCSTPPPPLPNFTFPDTLCQHSCAFPTDLKNRLANHIAWTINGPNLDTTLIDSTFYWCFDAAGTYTIEQEITLLGCSYFSAHTLEVLPDNLEVSLGGDRIICDEAPYLLIANSNRPVQTYHWNDGSSDPILPIFTSGEYIVEVSDGHCNDSDTINLTFIDDLANEETLTLPPDTTICPGDLPYLLAPKSPYTSLFVLDETIQDSIFSLTKAGIYSIRAEIENCSFQANFQLKTTDCPTPVFLPNVFSPNDDGINDLFFPQGLDYAGIRLQIFNRWGDLVFETGQAPFVWDGTNHGRALNAGVYVFVFSYFNQLNLTEEVVSGDVLLVR